MRKTSSSSISKRKKKLSLENVDFDNINDKINR